MKNTQRQTKSRRVDIAATLPHTSHGIANEKTTAEWQGPVSCTNLCPGKESGRLVPVDDFEGLAHVGRDARPILCWNHPHRGRCLLLQSGNMLTVVTGSEGGAETTLCHSLEPLKSRPMCAVAEGDGSTVAVMTPTGAYLLTADATEGLWHIKDANQEFPAAMFTSGGFTTLTTEVAEATLKGSYTATSRKLCKSDRIALRDDLSASIEEIECIARSSGRSIAPLLMRYRVKNATGQTLFLSPIVLIGTDKGYQLGEELKTAVTTGGSMRREGFTLSVESFKPTLILPGQPGEEISERATTLEVEAAGPLHGADADGIVWNNLNLADGTLRFYMPGMAATMASDTEKIISHVLQVVARFDDLCETVAVVNNPFATENQGRIIELPIPNSGLTAKECRLRHVKAISRPLRERKSYETLLTGGGNTAARFTADTGTNNGDTTLWGNITVLPFESWGAGHFAISRAASKSWSATVSSENSAGRAVCNTAGYDNAPTELSPLIVWPVEEECTMTVKVKTSDGTAMETIKLSPIAGSGLSAWLSPNLKPLSLDYTSDTAFTTSASTIKGKEMTGSIVSAPSGAVLCPSGMMSAPGSRIVGITTATALSSAWDFSRDRFYIFGEGGINLCITNARHEPVAVQLLDGRCVKSRKDIAVGTADRGVAAIAGGCAVNVKGSRTCDFPGITPDTACGIGWDGGDLWIMLEGGKAQVRPSESPDHYYLRDTPQIVSSLSCGDGCLRIIDQSGMLCDSSHRVGSEKEIEWSCRVELPSYVPTPTRGAIGSVLRITAIGLAMVASAVKARFTASSDGGAAPIALARLLLSAMISGTMKESLFLPVNATRRHWFTIGLSGTVSPDMRLSGISLHLK